MTHGLARRQGAQDSLAGQQDMQPVTLQGPGLQNPRAIRKPDTSIQDRIQSQLLQWGAGKLAEAVNKQQEKDVLDGQMAYQQGQTFDDVEMGGNKWALEGYMLMDAQTISSTLLAAQREQIQQDGYRLSPEQFRAQYVDRLDALLEGKDPRTSELVREQMARQMPTLVADHTTAHLRHREQQNFSSLERSIDVISRDPTAVEQLLDFAIGDEGSASSGLSPERRQAATVQGVIRAFDNDNPMAYSVLAKNGLLGDNLTTAEQNAVRAAQRRFEGRRRTEYNEELFNGEQELMRRIERAEVSPSRAVEELSILYADHGIKMNAADAGGIYNPALTTERQAGMTAATNFEEARLRGDYRTMAKITEPILIQIESGGDPNAVSPVGARGLMQVMDYTNRDPGFGITPARDSSAAERVRVGQDYWRTMMGGSSAHSILKWSAGDLEAASIAYNAGPGVANRWIESGRNDSVLPQETRDYKRKMADGLKGWKAPTAADRLRIAQDTLAHTRERLAMDTYEQMAPQLAELDDQFTRGELSRETWRRSRSELFGEYDVARTRADVNQEIELTRSVDTALAREADRVSDEGYKLRLEEANARLTPARLAWEEVINDPASTPTQIQAANDVYIAERNETLDEFGIAAIDRGNGAVAESLIVRSKEAIDRHAKWTEQQVEIDAAISGGYLSKLPREYQQRAFDQKEKQIVETYSQEVHEGRMTEDEAVAAMSADFNAFYAEAGVVDPKVTMRMTAAVMGPMIDKDGNPSPTVVDAITQYAEVKSANSKAADTMLDPEAQVLAEAVLSRSADPSLIGEAVRNIGMEQDKSPLIQDTDAFMALENTQKTIEREVDNYFETRDIGVLHAIWQEDARLDQVFDNHAKAKDRMWSDEVYGAYKSEVSAEVARLQRIMPGLRTRDLVAKANEHVGSRTEVIGGDLVMANRGQDYATMFFGGRATEFMHDGAINSAVVEWLQSDEVIAQHPFIEGFNAAEMLPGWVQSGADAVASLWGGEFQPAMSMSERINSGVVGLRPFRAFATPSGEISVQVLMQDGNYSDPIIVPSREAGELYMRRRRSENIE